MKTLLLSMALLFLSGCEFDGFMEKKAPKCSDENVVQTVKNIYADLPNRLKTTNPLAAAFMQKMPKEITAIRNIRVVSYDKEIKLRQCKAVAVLDDNQTDATNIAYTIQLS